MFDVFDSCYYMNLTSDLFQTSDKCLSPAEGSIAHNICLLVMYSSTNQQSPDMNIITSESDT